VFSLVPQLSTWHCPHLLLNAALLLLLGARRCQSMCPARVTLTANAPHAAAAVERWDGQTDGQTPDRYAYTQYYAGSVNK